MKVVCPGSYDPVTVGHIDIAARAAALFDEVVIAVVHNPAKTGHYPVAQRIELIEAALAAEPRTAEAANIVIDDVPGGLLVDYCAQIGAAAVVKGLRSGTDFAYELPMALMNRHLTELETIFLPGDPRFEHVSSSLIREVHALGGDVSGLVPAAVLAAMDAKCQAE
ncbi:pantetheine-phosphate adenylyltransferase [Brevibacterium gallinarum]|uniref:Phosphopantetheine adenylyltransferase n=1 Tax=Brevibacterium gallinarum TaxID=2762220 RepID=A0ABR8WS44_9MICO|nr:pantetheine-phosphate adenylyltransferase [Brevibacterium gallinarum]MBD8019541.1 pantetheine-phosphate adenylyltransferase [Brevibacterium gallinarum]